MRVEDYERQLEAANKKPIYHPRDYASLQCQLLIELLTMLDKRVD